MLSSHRAFVVALVILAGGPGEVDAQTSSANTSHRSAYIFVSNGAKLRRLGGSRGVLHFGFGHDWQLAGGFGLGVEAGPRFEDYDLGRLDDLMLSINTSYALSSGSNRKVVPFLKGGLSVGWEPVPDGQQTAFLGWGGGVRYSLNEQRGLLLELRDAVTLDKPQTGYHYLGFRVGYVWRPGR